VLLDTLLGPYTDVAFALRVLEGKKNGDAKFANMNVDMRILKPRIAGFMAVGGSTTPDQFTMALPTLHLFAYSLHIKVVDQVCTWDHGYKARALTVTSASWTSSAGRSIRLGA